VPATPRWILHLDLDQFIAAVEIRRRPELRGLPVVVGGDGNPARRRQVVATASYEARAVGVRSGLPLSTALRRCPEAIFLPADRAAYDEASAEVWGVVRDVVDLVEVWGWDEGFVGADVDDPEPLAHDLRRVVEDRTSFTCCVGIGDNKLRAKLATGFAKAAEGSLPADAAGVYRLTRDNWFEVMGARSTTALWGVGARTAEKLAAMGISTVDDLASADVEQLQARFGPTTGPGLHSLGLGEGSRTISTEPYVARGHSREETLREDLVERADLETTLRRLAAEVMADVGADRMVTHDSIKVRFAPFFTVTRIRKLSAPTREVAVVQDAAVALLDRVEQGRPVRLLGVRVSLHTPEEES
jgi:DNA polymerase-4